MKKKIMIATMVAAIALSAVGCEEVQPSVVVKYDNAGKPIEYWVVERGSSYVANSGAATILFESKGEWQRMNVAGDTSIIPIGSRDLQDIVKEYRLEKATKHEGY